MKKNSILFVIILFVIALFIFNISSCKDTPVNSNQSAYDSPRFEWQVTFIPGGDWIYSLWSPDTNEIFMTSWGNHLLHFKDGQITNMNYGQNIHIACIDGLNKNEGYMAGGELINGKYKPHIEKWNGSSFSNIPINYNFEDTFNVSHLLVKSSNEIWISSPKGLLYNFDGYNLTQYRLPDSTLISLDIINFENNRIRYIAANFDSLLTNDKYFVYEFDDSNWNKVHENKGEIFYGALNQMIYAYHFPDIIYKLEDNVLIPKIYLPKSGIEFIGGNSFENTMCFGSVNGRYGFIHWNGQSWSDEFNAEQFLTDIVVSKMVNDDYYCAVNSGLNGAGVIYRAYRKH